MAIQGADNPVFRGKKVDVSGCETAYINGKRTRRTGNKKNKEDKNGESKRKKFSHGKSKNDSAYGKSGAVRMRKKESKTDDKSCSSDGSGERTK